MIARKSIFRKSISKYIKNAFIRNEMIVCQKQQLGKSRNAISANESKKDKEGLMHLCSDVGLHVREKRLKKKNTLHVREILAVAV